jgi:branched-chain amino acid transport system permease protein
MQILLNGTIGGLTIGLLAIGFGVVYVPTRIYHLALGAIYAMTPFVVWACLRQGWGLPAAIGAALLASVVLSLACEALNHWPLERRKAPPGVHMIASLGVYIVLVQVIVLLWGNETKVLRRGLDQVFNIGEVVLTQAQLTAAVVSVLLFAAFAAWLGYTQGGLRFRALAENPTEFALRGYNVWGTRLVAFGWSGLLAASAALVVASDGGFVPTGGLSALLLAIVATIVGGRFKFAGIMLGGILLGILRSEVVYHFSARWQEAVTFFLLAVFLFVRPGGLMDQGEGPEGKP